MTTADPDGVEVVGSAADAAALPRPPLLVLDALAAHLDGRGIGRGPVRWARIGEGQSNVTFLLERDDASLVLRRGPRPPLPPSAHDMVREARMQQVLGAAGVPVPAILDICDDPDVIGVPFYLMGLVDGEVITDTIPASLDAPGERRATSEAVVDALVALHRIDVSDGPISSLGRPHGYLERQVRRFAALWPVNTRRDLPIVEDLAEWLGAHLPPSRSVSVVHGDYRIGNLMFARAAPARVVAILDWEMATLGDPLADLGYLTATYAEAGAPWSPMELTSVTRRPGYLSSDELVERYASALPFDETVLPWYETLALWKAAIFCEAIYTRYLDGQRPGDGFGPRLEAGVPALLERARERASRDA